MLENAILAGIAEEIHDISIVSVSHDPCIWNVMLKKVPGPDSIPGLPRVDAISPKAMDKDETSIICISL
jgi:hypothetical protein